MAATIEVRDLSHTYSAGTPFRHDAVKHMSFSVEKGEFLGIIGHTGSGKSTLIQHLNGLLRPTSGEILLDGTNIWQDKKTTRESRFRVGLVFQYPEYQLFEETVYRDIAFGPKNMGLSEEEIRTRVLRAAGFAGVDESLLEKSPFDLSGGQKRRVAIAGVIAMEPEVVIFDEPTAGLDPAGCASILGNIRDYQKATHATILMVTHSMDEVAQLADRMLVLNEGTIEMSGTPREVFSHAARLAEIGLSVPQVTALFLRLRELGVDVDPTTFTVEQAVPQLRALQDKKTTRESRFRVGLVFQYPEYQLFEETVYRDIAFGPKNMGLSEEEIRTRVLRAAGFAGVDESLLEKSPFDLSGGQKRRVAIAGVIAMEPEVVIFDEPTAGLDPAGCASILGNIRDYQKATHATILMVTHSMDEVAQLADRMLVLNEGTIEMSGTPREVFSHAARLAEIGLSVPQVTALFLRLRELGVDVDPTTFTVEQAVPQLRALLEGRAHA